MRAGAFPLIDLEKGPASRLLPNFPDMRSPAFDINKVGYPGHAGSRSPAPLSSMALCYRVVGDV